VDDVAGPPAPWSHWSPVDRVARDARALSIGMTACGLAAAAHASSGGAPVWWVTVLGVVFTARLVWPATRRRMGAARLVATTVGVQWAMHLAYQVTAQPASQMQMTMPGPASAGRMLVPAGHSMSAMASPGTFLLGWGDGRMLLSHLGVAVAFGLWLALLERQVWSLAARTGRRLAGRAARQCVTWLPRFRPRPVAATLTAAVLRTRRRRYRERPPSLPLLVCVVARRGPPSTGAIVCG
jgi:hypothetical protein